MPFFSERQYSSITVKIKQLAQEDERRGMESHIAGLIELIKIQPTSGPLEAARAIRKCIKYGKSTSEQLRGLEILEMLILNAGNTIAPQLARDDKLLTVLASIIDGSGRTGEGAKYNQKVRTRVVIMAQNWNTAFQDEKGYLRLTSLYRPSKQSQNLSPKLYSQSASFSNSSEDNSEVLSKGASSSRKRPPPRPTTTSPYSQSSRPQQSWKLNELARKEKGDKKKRKKKTMRVGGTLYADPQYEIPQINYTKEEPRIREVISDSHTHGTALRNMLILLTLDLPPLDDPKVAHEFEKCRSLRRKVLRYLQFVGAGDLSKKRQSVLEKDEQFLGALLGANEFLVEVFKQFDLRSGVPVEDDVAADDSDDLESYYTESDSREEIQDSEGYDDEHSVDTISGNFSRINFGSEADLANPQKEAIEKPVKQKDPVDPFGDGNALA